MELEFFSLLTILSRYLLYHTHIQSWYAQVVAYLGTDRVRHCLASVILREPEFQCDMAVFS